MSAETFAIPAGITHEPDFARMGPDERRKAGTKFLAAQAMHGGWPAVRAAKQRHPTLEPLRVNLTAYASAAPPPGFVDAVGRIIGGWLSQPGALDRTNGQDVAALNANWGGNRYSPANYFSRPTNKPVIARAKELFRSRGFNLPKTADTLSKIKKAARAAITGKLPCTRAFGSIGTLTEDMLVIGSASYRIEDRSGHPSIRLSAAGTRQYIRLDVLEKFINDTGLMNGSTGEPSPSPPYNGEGEMALSPASPVRPAPLQGILPENWPNPPKLQTPALQSPGDAAPVELSLSQRIAKLTQKGEPQAPDLPLGIDPLELSDDDITAWRASGDRSTTAHSTA